MKELDKKAISNIRVLTMEMITNAKSGHPGIALGAAPILYTLYAKVMRQTYLDPSWINRDRFILAAGHGSSLLYALLHLNKYALSIEDLKNFRQLNSKTPGHPEVDSEVGIDASSGPLGQGIPEAVGMSIASKYLGTHFNKEGFSIINNKVYVVCGDGDLQEGVTNEAMSLAGSLGLDNLIILFDSNDIQLDGEVSLCNRDDIKKKVESMNFKYFKVEDGNDVDKIFKAIQKAKTCGKPAFIEIKTIIGDTCSQAGTCNCHGAPLKDEEVEAMRNNVGGSKFEVFDETYKAFSKQINKSKKEYKEYKKLLKEYKEKYPDLYDELFNSKDITKDDLGFDFDPEYSKATRNSFGEILKKAQSDHFELIGGSADLSKSTNVAGINGDFSNSNPTGRNIRFGVREHAMAAIANGMKLFGITKPFVSGFFVFSDYLKPALRLSALMNLGVIYAFTHDSIAVGEDGPTHEPIEQLTMLRSIPNVNVIRPASMEETKEAFVIAYNSKNTPTVVVLTRQGVKEVRTKENAEDNLSLKGAYIISKEDPNKKLDGIILATGSEVSLAIDSKEELTNTGFNLRVVSMPSMYLFDKQSQEYKESILPKDKYIFAMEMSDATHMYKYVRNGRVFSINTFGASGKANDVINAFGYTKENICKLILDDLKKD